MFENHRLDFVALVIFEVQGKNFTIRCQRYKCFESILQIFTNYFSQILSTILFFQVPSTNKQTAKIILLLTKAH